MSDEAYWGIALALGLVVAVVAVVLLEVFLRQVHRVERGAGAVWTAGKQVARNTATTSPSARAIHQYASLLMSGLPG